MGVDATPSSPSGRRSILTLKAQSSEDASRKLSGTHCATMGCETASAKFIVFILNLILAVCGLSFLMEGVLILEGAKDLPEFLHEELAGAPFVLTATGALVFLLSSLGCCGVARGSSWTLTIYTALLVAAFTLELLVAALAFAHSGGAKETLLKKVDEYFKNYEHHHRTLDSIQMDLQCCGANGPRDYNGTLPLSCRLHRPRAPPPLPVAPDASTAPHESGCRAAVGAFVDRLEGALWGVTGAIAAVQVVSMTIGCFLALSFKESRPPPEV